MHNDFSIPNKNNFIKYALNVTHQMGGNQDGGYRILIPGIDENENQEQTSEKQSSVSVGKLLKDIKGKKVKLNFSDGEEDIDLYDLIITVVDFEGNWMKASATTKKGQEIEKLIPLSSILSFEIIKEN